MPPKDTTAAAQEAADLELWLFTNEFPFGSGEAFLENELPTLVARFKRVRIFPMHRVPGQRTLPERAEVTLLFDDPYATAGIGTMLRNADAVVALLRSLLTDLGAAMLRNEWRGELQSRIRQLVFRMGVMEKVLLPDLDPGRTVLYSYWAHDWVTLLALIRTRRPQLHFITRAHGFDLYEHQQPSGMIPFRALQLEQVDRLFCVSQAGLDHMSARHGGHASKFELARLGTRDHGRSRPSPSGPLQLVSCGMLIPRKRVHLVVEALSQVSTPVRWTHFGDGPGMAALRDAVDRLPPHIEVRLRGSVSNGEMMRWYAEHEVDLFLHTSELEGGVAVVLQEAASFGIPLIATDSGGVRDIVVPDTGRLLPKEVDAATVARLIEGFRDTPMATAVFREGVRRYWESNFRAERAYDRFCDRLIAIHDLHRQ
jgi:glycosyltransferase involved in cell wall biosynthesis